MRLGVATSYHRTSGNWGSSKAAHGGEPSVFFMFSSTSKIHGHSTFSNANHFITLLMGWCLVKQWRWQARWVMQNTWRSHCITKFSYKKKGKPGKTWQNQLWCLKLPKLAAQPNYASCSRKQKQPLKNNQQSAHPPRLKKKHPTKQPKRTETERNGIPPLWEAKETFSATGGRLRPKLHIKEIRSDGVSNAIVEGCTEAASAFPLRG